MAYDLAKVTANGNNLIAQILANKSSLSIDKIEISDTQLSSTTDISTMTSVPKVVQTVSANGFSKNSNTLIISTVVDNSSISADYKAWVFGIWGSDSQNGQSQLIAVITSTNSPDTIPAFSGSTPVSYTYKFNIGFSNASQIQFNMIDDSFATNDTVVHTTGDETIDGQKKFDTDPTDGAGNAYAKTVDVNQQLDKKVNIADMRKPASDVAGIEEVNAKQDAIGYTPADDSKVLHSTITQLNSTDMNTILTAGFYQSISGTDGIPSGDNYTIYQVIPLSSANGVQVAYETNNDILGMRSWNYNGGVLNFTSWIQFADDSKVVHTTDTSNWQKNKVTNDDGTPLISLTSSNDDLSATLMSLSAGLHTVYANSTVVNSPFNGMSSAKGVIDIQQSGTTGSNAFGEGFLIGSKTNQGILMYHVWLDGSKANYTQIANDSAAAHLSGANNFDTVPTVNNNPLLLASSLPSDLARTGSDQEFTGNNTFDTAPIDKTTGNPYITKDGVPSDVARTGQDTNFTAKLQQAGSDVITQANWVESDSDTHAQSSSKSDTEGFYYTEVND
ncbi:hypothetical protein G8J22_01347 [Lentilactobacillus hilgardii]|uniref:hypothetical protein n=1 Tax=Lentilactobacillus hilgardii TaxID=1588 RepID=UPI00019C6443|nr:hypothetical protein [Lentilactobacillus hilgardii]EEI18774.1 hypothetical protein HMPREF0497_2383 [Lentilactobacillus buchneri ATCC 11577]QIR09368.1 hypothetical protein G8J22_01347 [Lentilactobacillus hilgardii]